MSTRQRLLGEESDDEHAIDLEQRHAAFALLALLGAEESRWLRSACRRQHYLTRPELLPNPWFATSWTRLYQSRSNRAYITTMGIDIPTFERLCACGFRYIWDTTPISHVDTSAVGNPRLGAHSLDAEGALGLALHYINSAVSETCLQEIFAIIPSTVHRYIKFALSILLHVLRDIPEGAVRWPEDAEFNAYSRLIQECHPHLNGAFGTIDGLNVKGQESSDPAIENATFNGWLHTHCYSCVMAFSPEGPIMACNLNAPGSWHDSCVARPIYEKLHHNTPDGYYLVADTAFPQGTIGSTSKIKAPIKAGQCLPADCSEREEFIAFDHQLLSYRQSAEWGMRGLQGAFGCLHVPLPADDVEYRADLLEICVRMNNVRARCIGINQIRNVYIPMWHQAEDSRLWFEFENMLSSDITAGDRVSRFHLSRM